MHKKIVGIVAAIVVLIMVSIIILPAAVMSVVSMLGEGDNSSDSNIVIGSMLLSPQVEAYRAQVLAEAEKHGTAEYIDLFLAVMQQESGGNPTDVFQASESLGLDPNTLDVEHSIKQGVKHLSDMLKKAKCKSPTDIPGIKLSLQAYNFGSGYIEFSDWKWSQNSTFAYAKKYSYGVRNTGLRVEQLGPWRYGDQYYTEHVLRYYISEDDTEMSNPGKVTKVALDKRMDWLFPSGTPTSSSAMQQYLTQVSVPIYTSKKKKSTMTLTVHKQLANEIKAVFEDMQKAKFPILPDVTAAYCWRQMASNSSNLSYHSYGVCIDVNWSHNGATYTCWPYKPGKDKFAVTKKIVNIWKNHGFYWGGDWSEAYRDPMHFTYVNH